MYIHVYFFGSSSRIYYFKQCQFDNDNMHLVNQTWGLPGLAVNVIDFGRLL